MKLSTKFQENQVTSICLLWNNSNCNGVSFIEPDRSPSLGANNPAKPGPPFNTGGWGASRAGPLGIWQQCGLAASLGCSEQPAPVPTEAQTGFQASHFAKDPVGLCTEVLEVSSSILPLGGMFCKCNTGTGAWTRSWKQFRPKSSSAVRDPVPTLVGVPAASCAHLQPIFLRRLPKLGVDSQLHVHGHVCVTISSQFKKALAWCAFTRSCSPMQTWSPAHLCQGLDLPIHILNIDSVLKIEKIFPILCSIFLLYAGDVLI